MPGLAVEVVETGAEKAALHLRAVGARGADVMPLIPAIREIVVASEERIFASHGPGWPALADSTLANRASLGQGSDPEVATGALRQGLTSGLEVKAATPQAVKFGTSVPYARFQEGTKHQPKRQLMNLTIVERRAVSKLISAYVRGLHL